MSFAASMVAAFFFLPFVDLYETQASTAFFHVVLQPYCAYFHVVAAQYLYVFMPVEERGGRDVRKDN